MSAYQYGPGLAAWLILFMVLWIAHARGMKYAGTRLAEHRIYSRLATLGLALLSLIIALSVIDGWTVARFFGGVSTTSGYSDPVFGRSLSFYFFELPLYSMLINFVTGVRARRRNRPLRYRARMAIEERFSGLRRRQRDRPARSASVGKPGIGDVQGAGGGISDRGGGASSGSAASTIFFPITAT